MVRLLFTSAIVASLLLVAGVRESSAFLKGDQKSVIENVEPPAGSSVSYFRDANDGLHYEYTAPENFEEPIKIKFEGDNARPDIYVWADVIHWNDVTQSATASGRIIVDDRQEYRIETTYVEYNHALQQVYCPKKVKVIQKLPGAKQNMITATSAILTLDDKGIRSAKFEKIIDSQYSFDKEKNPLGKQSKGEAKQDSVQTTKATEPPPEPKADPVARVLDQRRKTAPAKID
jgi:lipopolysaccharide assembly outer membrane protein LptD (OstA)